MALGQELLDVPFAEMVRNLAFAIAEGQLALDRSAIETLNFLIKNEVDIIPEVTETIEPVERMVKVGEQTIPITGANIRTSGATPIRLNLLQAGLQPTFYQFTDTIIEVKIAISIRIERSLEVGVSKTFNFKSTTDTSFDYKTGGLASLFTGTAKFGVKNTTTVAYSSSFNAKYSQKYSFAAEGTSLLRTNMKPVPPPNRAVPTIVAKEETG